jgi:chromosome segregation ATPase
VNLDDDLHNTFTEIQDQVESAQQQLIKRSTRVTDLEKLLDDERAKSEQLVTKVKHLVEKQNLLESQLSTLEKMDRIEKDQTDELVSQHRDG